LNERGIANRSYVETLSGPGISPSVFLQYLAKKVPATTAWIIRSLISSSFGTPVLAGLAILGLLAVPWWRKAPAAQSLLIGTFALGFAQSMLIVFLNPRILLIFVPCMCIWAAGGFSVLWGWYLQIISHSKRNWWHRPVVGISALGFVGLLLLAVIHRSALRILPLAIANERTLPVKHAMEALQPGQMAPRPVMVSGLSMLAYHAGAEFVPFPYTDSDTALRYFDKRKVSFIVLTMNALNWSPYASAWWKDGIPSSSAIPIASISVDGVEEYRVYKWNAK
jgi:hypothetical protein